MIPTKQTDITVQSNVTGSKHEMGIHVGAMAHIMNILTDLYSDPELAIIREYSTNALDAHIEAGIKRPIEVTLPSALAPFLRIKDFGIGLDEDGIREIYSQYGASTKRGTNDQVGMLGLGCKSALTYTNQFVLVGIKDGVRTQVQVSRDEDGTGSMTVVSIQDTTDEPGVEVVIPAKRVNLIESKAKRFFSFWSEGTVLVNGAEPKRIDGLPVGDNLLVVNRDPASAYGNDGDKIVMGNVSYPADLSGQLLPYQFKLVAFVDVGQVDFTPSREALHMTPRTAGTIARIKDDLRRDIGAALNKEVEAATSKHEALTTVVKWRNIAQTTRSTFTNWTYKGQPIPEFLGTKPVNVYSGYATSLNKGTWCLVPRHKHKLAHHDMTTGIQTTQAPSTIWFTGYTDATWTPTKRKKLDIWVHENKVTADNYVFLDKMPPTDGWVDPATIFDYEDVKAIKLATAQQNPYASYKKIPGSYDDTFVAGICKGEVPADDIDQALKKDPKRKLFYVSGNYSSAAIFASLLSKTHKDCFIVPLPMNRLDKFLRLFPTAIKCSDGVKAIYATWEKGLTQDQKDALSMNDDYGVRDQHRLLDATKVDDPDLKRAIRIAKVPLDKLLQDRRVFAKVIGSTGGSGKHEDVLTRKYPLFSAQIARQNHPHLYLYLNAAYAAAKKA